MSLLLDLQHIQKSFSGLKALSDGCLRVYRGKVMALVGENGAGKSTLMKVLTGIYQKEAGDIIFLEQPIAFAHPRAAQAAGIGIVHQELNLIPQLTVAENIFLGRELTYAWGTINWKKMFEAADKLLQRLKVNFHSRAKVSELSIGEQQMVEIARVLSFQSQVIIMDEPTDALTESETQALFGVIRTLQSQGCGIVYISHRLKEIFEICDDVTVMRDGQFIAELPTAMLDENILIEMMVGRKLSEQYPRIDREKGQCALKVENLSGKGIHNVSFHLYEGEILGVAGLMGAGRTELMKMIYGALPITSGTLTLFDRPLYYSHPQGALKAGIVYVSEDRKKEGLVLGMSVKDNMTLTALKRFCQYLGKINQGAELLAVKDFVAQFAIKTPSFKQIIGVLSGGNQQKVAIAKSLMVQPKVLILDEPTRGVDVGAKKEIYQLINQFKQAGLSVILVSSDMGELLGMSDRVLVLHEGKVTGCLPIELATQEKVMAAAVGCE